MAIQVRISKGRPALTHVFFRTTKGNVFVHRTSFVEREMAKTLAAKVRRRLRSGSKLNEKHWRLVRRA